MSRYKAYPAYKDSGVEWLGDIPPHWSTSKLRYGFSFGKGLSITKENLVDEGIPCVNYGEVHSKFGFEVDPGRHALKCVDDGYLKSSGESLIKNGDFVFADTSEDIEGSGNFTQLRSEAITFAGYHTIIARPNNRKSARYFAYLFDSKPFRTQIRHAVKGVKVFSITQAILRGADIWLPSQDEQEKIAAFLDHETAKIDALIEKQQRLIELLKEKRQAVISHAVTKGLNPNAPMKDSGVEWLGEVPAHWQLTQIKHLVAVFEQGWSPQCDSRPAEDGEYGVLKVGCVNGGVFNPEENKALPPELKPQTQYVIKSGDLLVSRANTRELVGSAAVVNSDFDNLILCDKLYRLKLHPGVNAELVALYLSIPPVRQQIELGTSGASDSMQNISQSVIRDLIVLLPPETEANLLFDEVERKIAKFTAILKSAATQISYLQERRTALISAAVTGKIDVRDWQPAA